MIQFKNPVENTTLTTLEQSDIDALKLTLVSEGTAKDEVEAAALIAYLIPAPQKVIEEYREKYQEVTVKK